MTEINTTAYWFVLTGALWALVFLLVPLRVLKSLLLPGFLMGFAWTFALNYPSVNWLKLYHFTKGPFMIGGVPLLLAISWYGAIVLFFFFVLSYPRFEVLFVALGGLATAAVFATTVRLGHLKPGHYSTLESMYLGLISHVIALKVLRLFFPAKVRAPKMPPFE